MTIIFEQREMNDKVVLIQFQFPSHSTTKGVQNCSLDKYMSHDIWSQIYTKLQIPLEQYVQIDDEDAVDLKALLKSETLKLQRAQLELRLSWRSTKSFHKEVVRQESKSCDLCSYVLVVKIDTIDAIDKYRKLHYQETKTEKPSTKSIEAEKSTARDERTSNGSSSNDNEEYIPTAIAKIDNSLDYTPSSLSIKAESVAKSPLADEYTPWVADNEPDIVSYTPTKIAQTSQYTAGKKTDLNRNDYSQKTKRPKTANNFSNLFGTDSGDDVESNEAARYLRSKTKPTKVDVVKKIETKQTKIDSFVGSRLKKTTDGSKSEQSENGSSSREKKRKITAIGADITPSLQESNDEKVQKLKDDIANELQKFKKFSGSAIDLKEMSEEDIIDTFKHHKIILRRIFQENLNIADHRFNPTSYDYLAVLATLVTETQKKAMYNKVKSAFCKHEQQTITTNHENLIWKCLLPEWALNICMDKFKLSRPDAIERLQDQNLFEQPLDDLELDMSFGLNH